MRLKSMHSHKGSAVIAVLGAISLLSFIFFVKLTTDLGENNRVLSETNVSNKLAEISGAVAEFYERKAGEIDANDTALFWNNPDNWRSQIGVQETDSYVILVSERIIEPALVSRKLVVYHLDDVAAAESPAFDAVTGEFVPCPTGTSPCQVKFTVIDGKLIQQKLHLRAQEQVTEVAKFLQSYFSARMTADPDYSIIYNYFRSPFDSQSYAIGGTCSSDPAGELSCIDNWVPIANRPNHDKNLLELPHSVNSWGGPIEISNKLESNYLVPPYTMAVRTMTPNGRIIIVKALQQP